MFAQCYLDYHMFMLYFHHSYIGTIGSVFWAGGLVVFSSLLHMYNWICILGWWPCCIFITLT